MSIKRINGDYDEYDMLKVIDESKFNVKSSNKKVDKFEKLRRILKTKNFL